MVVLLLICFFMRTPNECPYPSRFTRANAKSQSQAAAANECDGLTYAGFHYVFPNECSHPSRSTRTDAKSPSKSAVSNVFATSDAAALAPYVCAVPACDCRAHLVLYSGHSNVMQAGLYALKCGRGIRMHICLVVLTRYK